MPTCLPASDSASHRPVRSGVCLRSRGRSPALRGNKVTGASWKLAVLGAVVLVVLPVSACRGEEPTTSPDDISGITPVGVTRLPLQPSVPSLSGDPQPILTDPIEAGLTRDEVIFLSQKCAGQAEVTNTASECFRRIQQALARQWSCEDVTGCVRVARRARPGVTGPGVNRDDAAVMQITDQAECGKAPNDVCLQLPATAALLNAQRAGEPTDRGSAATVTTDKRATIHKKVTTDTTATNTARTAAPATVTPGKTTPEADADQQASPGAGTAEQEPSPS